MIKRAKIRNYRSIEDLEVEFTPLCALVGENNAGKSNLLRAIKTVLGNEWLSLRHFSPEDFIDHDSAKDIVIELEFDPPPEYHGFATEDPKPVPVFSYCLTRYKRRHGDHQAGDLRLDSKPTKVDGSDIQVLAKALKRGEKATFRPLTAIPADVKRQVPLIYIGAERNLAEQLPYTRYSLLRRLLEDIAETIKSREVAIAGATRPLQEVFAERLSAVFEVLRIDEFEALEGMLRTRALENLGLDPERDADRFDLHFDIFEPMDFFKSLRLRVAEPGGFIDATDMGHGAQNALVIAIFQAYEQLKKSGAIFLVEEPEMYLHPHRARSFYDTLRRIAETNQVIYTTHSPHFVSVPDFDSVRIVYRGDNDRTQVRRSNLGPTDQLRERFRKDFDPERNELFFAQHVVLVEGPTEKLALPEWARRLGVDLDREGVSIVSVGGKRSLPLFADLVASFGIPHTIVFDRDSSDFSKEKKAEEEEFNAALLSRRGGDVAVIQIDPKFEGAYRAQIGDAAYGALCDKYPMASKVSRARLIAADKEAPVANFATEVFADLIEAVG